jgi:hypothetical protein
MTDVYSTPEKVHLKQRLFEIGIETLEAQGYVVNRVPGSGKSSVRQITKDGESKVVSIRTTQDQAIAFPRLKDDSGWKTLDEVDMVVAVSVDDRDDPRNGKVHLLDGDEMRDRFDQAYKARLKAGQQIPLGRGVWLGLYRRYDGKRVRLVGAGAGLDHKPVAVVPLARADADDDSTIEHALPATLSIAQAKRLLATSLGVEESSIKITVEA